MNEQLKIVITAVTDKLKKGVQDAKKEIGDLESSTNEASNKIKTNFRKAADGIKDTLAPITKTADKIKTKFKEVGTSIKDSFNAAKTSIAAIGGSIVGVVELTHEYRTSQAQLKSAFEEAGAAAGVATQVYNDLYRVLGETDTATEAANLLSQLTTNEKELAQWTTVCQGVYATFPDSLPIEGLVEASNETAKTGEVTGTLADAINWAKASNEEWSNALSSNKTAQEAFNKAIEDGATREEAFNEALATCTTEAEREKLIRESLNGVYGEAAANYEKNAANILAYNEAQNRMKAGFAEVANAIAPFLTLLMNLGATLLETVAPILTNVADAVLPALQEGYETLKTKIDEIKTAFENANKWVEEHKTLMTVLGVIIGGITIAILAYNAAAIARVAMSAAETIAIWALIAAETAQAAAATVASVATTAFGAAMAFLTSPIALVIIGIAAVIAIIVVVVKHWDKLKEVAINVWNKVKDVVQTAVDKIVSFFQKIIDWISNNWQSLLLLIVNPFAGAFKLAYDNCEQFREKVNTVFTNIKDGVKSRIEALKENVKSIFNQVKTLITTPVESARTTIKSTVDKIKSIFNFKWSLPKPSIPKFSVSGGKAPWGFGGKGSLPKISIRWNKLGGIFDKPTLFNYGGSLQGIGEDGAEAVVPLEKNTKWLDKLADRITAKQGNTPIVLQVDGKTFAQVSIDSINALTRQRGSLGLNIV